MIVNKPTHLLFIEPQGNAETPVEDNLTTITEKLLSKATEGNHYLGWHTCWCGEPGGSCDLILPDGTITNALATHYMREHRSEVPQQEITKLIQCAIRAGLES